MKNNNITAIVFDMDGVLLDTETISDRTWLIAGSEYGIAEEKIRLLMHKCMGTNKQDTNKIIKQELGQDFPSDTFLQRTSQLFFKIESEEGIQLMPYVKEALDYLSSKYIVCLASSTRKEHVTRQLTNLGLIKYFKTITTGDMVKHSKPEPEIYLLACSSIGVEPKNCIAIEDSPNGIKSAHKAGLTTIMVPDKIKPTEELKPYINYICKSLQEVVELL